MILLSSLLPLCVCVFPQANRTSLYKMRLAQLHTRMFEGLLVDVGVSGDDGGPSAPPAPHPFKE